MKPAPSSVDRYLNAKTHRVDMATVNVLSFASNLRRRARELGLKVTIDQEGHTLIVASRKRWQP